jgi:sulfur carrier protein
MHIQLNGKPHPLDRGTTLAQLVEQLDLADKRIAVEVNDDLVPRSEHPRHQLSDGDRVEIVQAIGGG